MRGIFIDTETGGLDAERHALLSVAAVAFETNFDGTWTLLDSFNIRVTASPFQGVTSGALGIQGIGWEDLNAPDRIDEQAALLRLAHWLADWHSGAVWAHNATFDWKFLRSAFFRMSERERAYDHWRPLKKIVSGRCDWGCTMNLATLIHHAGIARFVSFKLDELLVALDAHGRSGSGHQALEDAMLGIEVLNRLLGIAGWTRRTPGEKVGEGSGS